MTIFAEKNPQNHENSQAHAPSGRGPAWRFVVGLTLLYGLLAFAAAQRRIWYDELFTLDIARASSPGRLMLLSRLWDLNPPLSYFLARASMHIFGPGKLGLRLPSILEFYAGSLFLFAFARRYLGNAFGVFAVFILWDSPYFYYSVEARPYALLFMSFAGLLYFWDRAVQPQRTRWDLAGVFLFTLCLICSHVFAPLSLAAVMLAELVRSFRQKKVDLALWLSLLVPCAAMVTYLPLFKKYDRVLFPPAFQASPKMTWLFYHDYLWTGLPVDLLFAYSMLMVLTLLRGRRVADTQATKTDTLVRVPAEHIAAAVYLLATPLLLSLVLMHGHGAFWPRYVITCGCAAYLGIAFLFAHGTRAGRHAVLAACAVLLFFAAVKAGRGAFDHTGPHDASAFNQIDPELPLVDASGEIFFEMNHYESSTFLKRLYYLKDYDAAVKYANASMYETHEPPEKLGPEFEIQAHVEQYSRFVAAHPAFIVLGRLGDPQDWLLSKLQADKAEVINLGDVNTPYADSQVFLVHMPADPMASSGVGK